MRPDAAIALLEGEDALPILLHVDDATLPVVDHGTRSRGSNVKRELWSNETLVTLFPPTTVQMSITICDADVSCGFNMLVTDLLCVG
jgi:hypothetical protein